jgi:hypothetical protein
MNLNAYQQICLSLCLVGYKLGVCNEAMGFVLGKKEIISKFTDKFITQASLGEY